MMWEKEFEQDKHLSKSDGEFFHVFTSRNYISGENHSQLYDLSSVYKRL